MLALWPGTAVVRGLRKEIVMPSTLQTRRGFMGLSLLGLGLAGTALAQKTYGPGASDTEIRIGQTMAYSGPLSAYGALGKVEAAYYRKINDEGGIRGRMINFISLDDGYNPAKTVEGVRRLVEQDEVLFLAGSLGTPTNQAVKAYLHARKVPLLFLATGGSMWDNPQAEPWVMGWQPNYRSEARIYAQHILAIKPNARIAVLYQNDDTGKDYLNGFKDGLGDQTKLIVAELSYEVTAPTLDSQLLQMQAAGADVLFDQTTPKFAAQVIRRMSEMGWKPVHYLNNIAASIGAVLVPAGLDNSKGLISTIFMKDTTDPQLADDPAVKEWAAFMKKYNPSGNLLDSINVSGYSVAQTVVQVLMQCGDDLSRENVMRQAAALKNLELGLLMPGVKINTSPTDHAPIKSLRMRRFDGKQWIAFGEVMGR